MKICERCKKDIEGLEFHTCNKKQEVSAVASNDGVMCDYCEKEKNMMETEIINPGTAAFCGGIRKDDIERLTDKICVFVDSRGYLRMVDIVDSGCLDHGEKIKISFCPVCGNKINI